MRAVVTGLATLVVVGVGIAGCGRKSPVEPSPVCTIVLTPASHAFPEDGGQASIAVESPSGCSWSATSATDWAVVTSGSQGSGRGTVVYNVGPNASAVARTGAIGVGDQRHSISQVGRPPTSCTYVLSPAGTDVGKDAAEGAFVVDAPNECAWTATSTADWVTVTAGSAGTGDGRVSYRIARNMSFQAREATIAVGDARFAVRQSGDAGICDYVVAPVDVSVCMPGGTVSATLTTAATCPWTTASTVPWLTVETGSSGNGPGPIRVRFTDNYDAPREGLIQVRWPTATVGQNVRVMQAGCRYAVSQAQYDVAAAGGTASFDVVQQSDPTECGGATQNRCVWSARADVDWITVTSPMPRTGDDRVLFSVAANTGASSRTGRIAVRDKTVVVTQAAAAFFDGTWNGQLIDYPGGRSFQMVLTMVGNRVTGTITGEGTGGGGYVIGVYSGSGPVHLEADFGDGKQYFDGAFEGPNRVRGTSTYNQRPPVYQFVMNR